MALAKGTPLANTGLRLAALNLGHFYTHLFLLLHPTVVLAMERASAGSYGDLLMPSTAAFVAFGLGTLPAGWLGDRIPRESLMTVFFLGLGLGGGIAALASNAWVLTLGLAVIGLSASIYHPVGIAMVVEGRDKVGRVLGINGVFGNLGVAAAPLFAGGLASLAGWQAAFAVPALMAGVTGLGYLALVWGGSARRRLTKPVPAPPPDPLAPADRTRLIGALAVASICGGLVFHAVTVVLPKLFDDRLAGGLFAVGGVASLVLAAAAFTQIAVGTLIDRWPIKPVFVAVVIVQAPLLLAAGAAEGPVLVAVTLVLMASVFGEIPIHDALIARHVPSAWRARIYAVKYAGSLGVSAAAVPLVAGLYGAEGGSPTLFAALAVLSAAVAMAALSLPRPRKMVAEPA